MILFLDFDGVLHPQYDGEPTPVSEVFCHLPRFEAVMRDFPSVDIVISSTWRNQFTLDELRSRFSPDIAARIIDVTPQIECCAGIYLAAKREYEIVQWLVIAGQSDRPWIALDDAVWQFLQYRDRIVACTWYMGLNDAVELKLRSALTDGPLVIDCDALWRDQGAKYVPVKNNLQSYLAHEMTSYETGGMRFFI